MAPSIYPAILAIFCIILPSIVMTEVYEVGGDQGWTTGVDYAAWAQDKVFRVGDTLVFKYSPPHDVIKVDGSAFKACTAPDGNNTLTTGNDAITLSEPGKQWFICGVFGHCSWGQKLVINVQEGPGPAPGPTGTAQSLVPSCNIYLHGLMAAIVALAMLMALMGPF